MSVDYLTKKWRYVTGYWALNAAILCEYYRSILVTKIYWSKDWYLFYNEQHYYPKIKRLPSSSPKQSYHKVEMKRPNYTDPTKLLKPQPKKLSPPSCVTPTTAPPCARSTFRIITPYPLWPSWNLRPYRSLKIPDPRLSSPPTTLRTKSYCPVFYVTRIFPALWSWCLPQPHKHPFALSHDIRWPKYQHYSQKYWTTMIWPTTI